MQTNFVRIFLLPMMSRNIWATGCPISNRGISKAYWAVIINMGIVVTKAKLVKRSLHLWNQHVKNLGCFCPILIWGISDTYCCQSINFRKKCNAPFYTHFWLNLWYWNQILKILTFSVLYLIWVIFKEDFGLIRLLCSSWVFHTILVEYCKYSTFIIESINKSWAFQILN